MQVENAGAKVSERIIMTPFSDGSRPDAFKGIYLSLAMYLMAVAIYFLYKDLFDPLWWSIKISAIATLCLISCASALFCRVELGDSQVVLNRVFAKTSAKLADIKSIKYESAAMITRLVISTDAKAISMTSLSFSARQLNAIRNYCEGRQSNT